FEWLDEAHLFRPAQDLFVAVVPSRFGGTYIVFPTLQPFAEPPPLPSVGLSAEDAAAILGADANRAIYEEPDPALREGSARFGRTSIACPPLRPCAEPPPLPSVGLSAEDAAAILGADANRAIYEEPDPVLREGSARFRLSFRYRVRVEGIASSFSLGAFGI